MVTVLQPGNARDGHTALRLDRTYYDDDARPAERSRQASRPLGADTPLAKVLPGCLGGGVLESGAVHLFTVDLLDVRHARFQAWAKADIDLYVLDPNGEMVAWDTAGTGVPSCALRPLTHGEYTVKLVNNERRAVEYRMFVSVSV